MRVTKGIKFLSSCYYVYLGSAFLQYFLRDVTYCEKQQIEIYNPFALLFALVFFLNGGINRRKKINIF